MSTEPQKTSRAGRDLPAAIGIGVSLGAGIIAVHGKGDADAVEHQVGFGTFARQGLRRLRV